MRAVGLEDVLGRERYGAERDAVRRRVIAYKRSRRAAIGDRLSLLFEDLATVWYQTQEMLWVERITDLDAIRAELAVYNALLPGANELSATLLIEIEDELSIREELHRLIGIDEHLALEVEGVARSAAAFEPGRSTEEKLSAVQYVRFPLAPALRDAIAGGASIRLVVDHPAYRVQAALPENVRASLAAELADPSAPDRALAQVRDGA
jgi:hypothetical protein